MLAAAGIVLAALAASCRTLSQPEQTAIAPVPAASVPVEDYFPVVRGRPAAAALWQHAQDPSRNLLFSAEGDAGVTVQALDGSRRQRLAAGAADFLALSYGFDAGSGPGALLVVQDRAAAALRAYAVDAATGSLRELAQVPLALGAELTGLCLYRSPLYGRHYAFAATDDGELQQWEFSARNGGVAGRMVRRIPVGKGVAACATDDASGTLYLADETVGIWRLAADPETDTTRELVALVAPRGPLGDAVQAIASLQWGGTSYLLAADEDGARIHVLALPEARHAGSFTLQDLARAEFGSLWASAYGGPGPGAGLVLVADEGGPEPAFRRLSWQAIATALELPGGPTAHPRGVPPASARTAEPVVESQPVDDFGDAADDPAIWVHPTDPSRSLVIGAQKKRGVEVYDLSGRRLQMLADGRTNNVDLRQGVLLGGRPRDIVAGSNRTSRALALYEVDGAARRLIPATAAPLPSGLRDPYGLCMYHSARSGRLYVFMNDSETGAYRQWEIAATGATLTARLVREFAVGSQAEGCVADDETGALYVAEEDVGLWRYGAEPDAGAARTSIDTTGADGHLRADVEGIGIFHGKDGKGWIVVSNQGADNYAVYRRDGDNAFIGHFHIVANDARGIDGASETDGLDVTSRALGPRFPYGLLVVQDGRNLMPAERQNYKLVPWERVAGALALR